VEEISFFFNHTIRLETDWLLKVETHPNKVYRGVILLGAPIFLWRVLNILDLTPELLISLRKGLWCVPHECPNQIPHIIH
jgi:hypothetical protein